MQAHWQMHRTKHRGPEHQTQSLQIRFGVMVQQTKKTEPLSRPNREPARSGDPLSPSDKLLLLLCHFLSPEQSGGNSHLPAQGLLPRVSDFAEEAVGAEILAGRGSHPLCRALSALNAIYFCSYGFAQGFAQAILRRAFGALYQSPITNHQSPITNH